MRVSALDGEVGLANVGTVKIGRRRGDAEVRIRRVAVARGRPGRGRHPASGGRGGRPGLPGRGRHPDGRGRLGLGRGRGRGAGRHDGGDDRGHRPGARLRLGTGTTGSRTSHEADHAPDEAGGPGASPPRQLAWWARGSRRWWRSPAGRRPLLGWLSPTTAGGIGSVGRSPMACPSASSLSTQTPRSQQRRQGRLAAQMCLHLPNRPELPRIWGSFPNEGVPPAPDSPCHGGPALVGYRLAGRERA